MDKKFSRIIKKNNNSNYILKGLIKKNYIQKGGETKVALKNTQEGLLKALKSFPDINISANPFLGSIDELNKTLANIKTNFIYKDQSKEGSGDTSTFTQNLNKFDKFLNDISGGEVKLEYKNDYKMKDLLNVDLKSLNEINTLFEEVADFKERNSQVSLEDFKKLNIETNIDFIERNKQVSLEDFKKLNIETDIDFNERTKQISLEHLKALDPTKNIEFNERRNQVGLNLDGVSLPNLADISLDPRTSKVSMDASLLKPKIVDLNFQERNKTIDLSGFNKLTPSKITEGINLEDGFYENKMKASEKFLIDNSINEEKVKKLKTLIDIIKKLNRFIKNGIIYYKKDIISDDKMKEIVTNIKFIENELEEKEDVDGIDLIPIKPTSLIEKDVFIGGKQRLIEDGDMFLSEEFVDTIWSQRGGFRQFGGALINDYLEKTSDWANLLKDRYIVNEFKNTINEYNIVYIQSYYHKLFVLKNINKFSGKENKIYQFIKKPTLLKYIKILNRINKYISNPETEIMTVLSTKETTIHYYLYFKHYIIIKNLLSFFNNILEKWTNDTYKLDIFNYDDNSEASKEIIKNFLLFNLFYKILDKYNDVLTKFI